MRNYEIILMINPNHNEYISNMIEEYKKFVIDNNGKLHRLEDWGRLSLCYPIKKIHKAHYILMNIEVSSDIVKKLDQIFRFNDAIIRNMVIRVKKPVTEPSCMIKICNDNSENFIS